MISLNMIIPMYIKTTIIKKEDKAQSTVYSFQGIDTYSDFKGTNSEYKFLWIYHLKLF